MNRKNIFLVILLILLTFSFVSCGNSKPAQVSPALQEVSENTPSTQTNDKTDTTNAADSNRSLNNENIKLNTIQLKRGNTLVYQNDELTVTLRENPTTGYRWSWSEDEKAPENDQTAHIKLMLDNYLQDKQEGPDAEIMVGVGGKRTFSYKLQNAADCISEGSETCDIHLILVESRSWEPPSEDNPRINLTIRANAENQIVQIEAV